MKELVNNLPEFLLWGSALYFWGATILFIIFLFVSEVKENGWVALVSFGIFTGVLQMYSNVDMLSIFTVKAILLYLGIGLTHSLIRTYLYGRRKLKYDGYSSSPTEEEIEKNIEGQVEKMKKSLKGRVFRWWFLFPVSLLTWIFSDLLKDVYNFLYSKLKSVFVGIFNIGQNSIKNETI